MATRMNPRPGAIPTHFYCTCGCRQGWKPWPHPWAPDTITEGHPPRVIYAYRKCLWAYARSTTVAVFTRAYAPGYQHDPTKVAASGASGFNVEPGFNTNFGTAGGNEVPRKQYPCFCIGRACKLPSETLPDNQYCKKLRV